MKRVDLNNRWCLRNEDQECTQAPSLETPEIKTTWVTQGREFESEKEALRHNLVTFLANGLGCDIPTSAEIIEFIAKEDNLTFRNQLNRYKNI